MILHHEQTHGGMRLSVLSGMRPTGNLGRLRGGLGADRQRDGEGGAASRAFASAADAALMKLDDGAGDGEAEAEARWARARALIEGLEEVLRLRGVKSDTAVTHLDADARSCRPIRRALRILRGNIDAAPCGVKFTALRSRFQKTCWRRARSPITWRWLAARLHGEADLFLATFIAHDLDGLADERMHIAQPRRAG